MKKIEVIDKLVEDFGKDRSEMEEMKYNDLRRILKTLEDLAKEQSDAPSAEQSEPTSEEQSEAPSEFESMCGLPFDPSKSAGCWKQCSKDYPDSFAECERHFRAQQEKKKSRKKSRRTGVGMNKWHHRNGSQAAKIDELLWEGRAVPMSEFLEATGSTRARVMSHFGHLVADWRQDIRRISNGKDEAFFWADACPDLEGEPVRGKTAYPNGFPKRHPLYNK